MFRNRLHICTVFQCSWFKRLLENRRFLEKETKMKLIKAMLRWQLFNSRNINGSVDVPMQCDPGQLGFLILWSMPPSIAIPLLVGLYTINTGSMRKWISKLVCVRGWFYFKRFCFGVVPKELRCPDSEANIFWQWFCVFLHSVFRVLGKLGLTKLKGWNPPCFFDQHVSLHLILDIEGYWDAMPFR